MFGQVIKKVRKEKGMTQEDVARALNVKTSEISQYESGKRLPRLNTFLMLLDLFNLTADEALGREVEAVCDNSNYGSNDAKDTYMDLYDSKSYFYHTPRIRNYLKKEKILLCKQKIENI